ncbi:PBECR2 nuclease fold domain-containing protein [Helicobacter canis]|uniref:Uncharacterized protein n=1 Tax=Helicobacter canis NCTC 12740 TaxID=1357399 RepID=V8CJR7_9HELI|nr:PBECR2 nuclease fold domain-containing protein [Helicobacter canis]ETD27337.1 hypothetical protein HMPREF2087_00249 [Helicobacter canis NCTC 12740]
MYCLEKLQRELAYFFDMDLRELPRVQDLLVAKGYTQVQKGDEIIKLEPSQTPKLESSAQAESTLSTKTTSKLTKEQLEALPLATPQEYGEFLEKIAQKDYQNTPEILKIATLNNDLQELINNNHSASVFITRARAGHISEARKGEYSQALTLDEQKQIPAVIAQAKEAYTDEKSGFILPFADKNNDEKINLIILDSDSKGNFLITAKKVNSAELNNPKYKKLARAGVEPTTTTPPKAEQKPTEAISLASDEIIPQPHTTLSKQAQDHAHQILQGLRKTAQTPLNKLADEVRSTDRRFMLREARYIKQSAQEFADNFANLRWQDLSWAIRYAKVPYNEAMFKELKAAIESKEFARFIESSYPPNLRKKAFLIHQANRRLPPHQSLLEPSAQADSSLASPKQKTIEKIDSYIKSDEFKALSKDKQEAILSLKDIEPSPMPQEVTQENLENLLKHFNSKQDRAQREFYAKLFNDTKENPDITLEVKRDNETRQEYIKAYQHKDTHDLYYIAIAKDNDTIKVTGYPITKIKDVINQIKNAEKVVWRHQGDQTHTALDFKKSPNLESAENIIPQSTQEKPKWSRADSKKWKLDKLEQTKAAAIKLYEQLQPIYNQARPLLIKAKELKSPAKAKELKDKAWELIEQESKPFIKELERHALELDRAAFILYPESASIKIQPKRNSNLEWKNKTRGAQGLKGAAKYRAQALQRLSEKDYMTPFEQATKASNPLTSLHALKFEILKDLHKAKVYINQQGYDKDLHKTYLDYVNRASSELDSIEQSIRELKSKIHPKPQRVQEVRSKVQDFIKWRDEVRFDTDYLLALESDGVAHALEYLEAKLQAATLPQQASFITQLKEQIKEHFPTQPSPQPPKPTPPEPSSQAEVGAAIHTDTTKVDSSVETKELHTKTTSKLTKDELDNLPIATAQEYGEFLEKIAQKDYQNTPEILKIATLNNDLQELINNNHSASVFITRARAGHISEARKGEYSQALTLDEQKQIPAVIAQAKEAYTDEKSGFILPFADKNNDEKINLIILDSDSKGNFLITAKKVNSAELNNPKYKKLARAGVEPTTTTPPKAEQKPTEAISLASDEIIPQTQMPKDNSDPVKTFEYFRDDFIKEYPKALEFYSGQIPLASELSYRVEKSLLNEIETIKKAMNNTAKDKFKELLKNIGLKQNEIAQVLDTTIRSDIDFTLDRVKDYLDYVARHLENFPPEHKPIAQEILAHSQNILNIFENKAPKIEQLQKKRELIDSFHNNAKTSNTKEQDLLKGLIDELYKPQSLSKPKPTPPEPSSQAEVGAAIHTDTPKLESSLAYTDTQGHTHQIPEPIAQKWLETFGLKDLQEPYTPKFSEQVAQALEPILQGESIKLYAGSLIKLIKENRLQYLDRIQPTLEQPQRVILQNDGALIFARDFGDEKYFTSVARNDDGEWIIRSNAPKSESGLDNKITAGGREIYNSQAATQINAHSPYDDIAKSNTKLDSEIIPQSLDTLPTPAQNLIKKLLYQIRSLEKSPSFREHDKIIAELKKSNDTQMLATLLKIFDERYPSAKDHYLLSGLRESIQNTLNKLSNPHIAKVLQAFTEKHPNPRDQAQAVKELYHRYGTPELKGFFDKVLSAAGDVKFSIRQTYANANGKYSADKHLITLNRRWALDSEPQRLAQTLLHELIHATIARAQYHRFSPQAYPELAHKLTPAQKSAVQEIDDLYILAFKTHQAQKRAKTLADDEQEFYGFTNSKEFVAELANPNFRSYLEKQNIFKRVLEAIVKFFTDGGGEQTSILKALQESYEKYLDNFGERSESFFGKTEGGASPSESRTLFDKADSSESFSYTTGKAKSIGELRKDLKQALEPSLNKEIVNKKSKKLKTYATMSFKTLL